MNFERRGGKIDVSSIDLQLIMEIDRKRVLCIVRLFALNLLQRVISYRYRYNARA